jgi:hypothetical protein
MAKTDRDVRASLARAAEALLGRTLQPSEVDDLMRRLQRADGTFRDRANEALRGFTGFTDTQIRVKAASSDNADRVIKDLENILDDWKPGT